MKWQDLSVNYDFNFNVYGCRGIKFENNIFMEIQLKNEFSR